MAFDKIPSVPVNLFPRPFADNGTYQLPPDNKASAGRASLKEGFPVETQLPLSQGGIAPNRLDVNGALHMLSAIAFWEQSGGMWPYRNDINYAPPAIVVHNGSVWWCVNPSGPALAAKAKAPGSDANYWIKFSDALGVVAAKSLALTGDVTGTGSFDSAGNMSVATTCTQAAKLKTAKTISLSGAVTGSADFDGSKAIDIVTNLAGFSQLLAKNGYIKFPGGLVLQWGELQANISAEIDNIVTFPTPFPTEAFIALAIPTISTSSIRINIWMQLRNLSLTSATFFSQRDDSNTTPMSGFQWFALGK